MTNFPKVPGFGPYSSPLMLLFEAPGKNEELQLKPLVGVTGNDTDNFLKAAGSSLDACYRTNVFKYRPPGNKLRFLEQTGHTIEEGLPELEEEIDTVDPAAILTAGNLALKTLTGKTGIKKWRGSILQSLLGKNSPKVIPTIHPAALYHQEDGKGAIPWAMKSIIQLDFKRAVDESRFRAYTIPERALGIARTSLDLHQFLSRNKDHTKVTVDIESIRGVPVCIGLAFGPSESLTIPLHNFSFSTVTIPERELSDLWRIAAQFLEDERTEIIGHNFKYDWDKLLQIGFRIRKIYADTMLQAHTLHPELPKTLAFLTSIYTREPYYKDEGREFNPKTDRFDRLLLYNGKDVTVDYELYETQDKELEEKGLNTFFKEVMMPLVPLYLDIESVGLKVNEEERVKIFNKYHEWNNNLSSELFGLIGHPLNLNSNPQVHKLLYGELRIPLRKDVKEDTLVSLLSNVIKDENKKKIVEGILTLRRIRKTITTYVLSIPDHDGRMRTSYRIDGTETGRRSTQKQKSPVRNSFVVKKKKYALGIGFQTLTKHGDYGTEIRSMLIPDEGCCFLEADLSQAEARIVALLANDDELLELFARKFDIHRLTSHWFFKQIPVTIKDAITDTARVKELIKPIDENERFVGKTGRHMCNYDAQKHRLMLEINTGAKRFHIDIKVSEWKAGQIIDIFHKNSPKVRNVFHEEVQRALYDNKRMLINPFGRPRLFLGRWDHDLFKEAYAQLPQSTVPDMVALAIKRIKTRLPWLRIPIESHDSITPIVPIGIHKEVGEIIKEEFERPVSFERCSISRGELTIPCELKVGFENLRDMVKL